MSTDLDNQIAEKESELAPLRQRMEETKMEFVKETVFSLLTGTGKPQKNTLPSTLKSP
jgi:hypothetical protein